MSKAGEESLLRGLHIGQSLSQPWYEGSVRKEQRQQALQDQDTLLRNHLLISAAQNPDLASSVINGDTLPGVAYDPNTHQKVSEGDTSGLLKFGDQYINPATYKSIHDASEAQKAQRDIDKAIALYGIRPQNQFIIDPVTGNVSLGDKRTGSVRPATQAGTEETFSNTAKPNIIELVDPATGNKMKYNRAPDGTMTQIGVSDTPKGVVVTDPVTGAVSIVNPNLPNGQGAGQAAPVTVSGSGGADQQPNLPPPLNGPPAPQTTTGPKPFSLSPKPNPGTQVSEGAAQKIAAYDALLKQYQAVKDSYTKSKSIIGPVAGRVSEFKSQYGGLPFVPKNTPEEAELLSKVNSLRGEAVHDKYGGALSPQELNFANQYILNAKNPDSTFVGNVDAAIDAITKQRESLLEAEKNRGAKVDKFVTGAGSGDNEKTPPPSKVHSLINKYK